MLNIISGIFKSIFGSKHERDIKKIVPLTNIISAAEILYLDYETEDFPEKTGEFEKYAESGCGDNYIKNFNAKIISAYKELKSKKSFAVEHYIERYRKIFFDNRKDLERKYDKSKMRLVVLNAVTDERLEKLVEGLRIRLEKWIETDETELETNLTADWNKYLSIINQENALDILLPEAFSLCREASMRRLGLRHFDVQMMGGAVLHQGKISEMKTGEGKTLVATLAVV
ncbi:MAG TPA: hypothetical protein PLQ81_15330, partial [bacterium]|nr:hypothetical protein [bacterium]